MVKNATGLLLGAAAIYAAYRYFAKPAAPAADDNKLSPMVAPNLVTSQTIDAASQFVTKDLVSWMGGKAVT